MPTILCLRKVHLFTVRAPKSVVCTIRDILNPFLVIFVENMTISVYLMLNVHYDMGVSARIAGLSEIFENTENLGIIWEKIEEYYCRSQLDLTNL
jgi:hypothetical protein